jgi:hypothetical protein
LAIWVIFLLWAIFEHCVHFWACIFQYIYTYTYVLHMLCMSWATF